MKITAPSSNLGDNLWITAALKYCNYPVQMKDAEKFQKYTII